MKLQYILSICLFCCYYAVSAQNVGTIEVITLNNKISFDGRTTRTAIKGEVLQESEESVLVKLSDGTELTIPVSHIKKRKQSKVNLTDFYASISAQNVGTIGVIILNDESTIKGEVLSESAETVIIKLTSGTEISIPANSIKKIKARKDNFTYYENGKARKEKGYFGFVKTGLLFARSDYELLYDAGGNFQTVHGYRINKNISVGLGIGIANYDYDTNFVPIYAHVRYEPFDKKNRFYISNDIGFAIHKANEFSDDFSVGFLLQPAIGVQFADRSGGGFFMELGQNLLWTERTFTNWWDEVAFTEKWRFNKTAVTIGYQF